MQQFDQARAAFVDDAELPSDIGADYARRARQSPDDPSLQPGFLRLAQKSGAAAKFKPRQALDARCGEQIMPLLESVVVEKKRVRDPLAIPALIQKQNRVGATRCSASPFRASAVRSARSSAERKPPRIMPQTNPKFADRQGLSRVFVESGYSCEATRYLLVFLMT